ncbi:MULTISPECIES: hypothetical protein [Actinokineospora]|uniref:Uncharacterized protein n=1 Tax=Actinokineospora fastidiosa TaxID=1816 RepID=A0A918LEQ3_9PSEU|nr:MULTISPECIES: hypothetical protein [Actinokineospora]UVS80735.1 hypothetical protein Actkin_04487 [Actinokineospora sp. UTMC 2448]GGS36762.1 hypothetical protein GCM10010171_34510 [Actinokineospora fastidiosa]
MTEHPRGIARRLVTVTRGGAAPGVDAPLDLLGGPDERTRLRAVIRELVDATAAMLLHRGGDNPDHLYLLDLRDAEGNEVSVDDLTPPVRALVRAVLADLNGRPEDVDVQLELSVRNEGGDPLSVLVLALLWTVGSLEWCEAHDADPPAWLAQTA